MRDFSIIPATMNPVVNPDLQREVDFFMKWGYLVVENAIPMETVAILREALDDSIGHRHGADQFTHQLLEEDDAFAVLLDNPPILKRMTAILGNCIQLHSATARINPKGSTRPGLASRRTLASGSGRDAVREHSRPNQHWVLSG